MAFLGVPPPAPEDIESEEWQALVFVGFVVGIGLLVVSGLAALVLFCCCGNKSELRARTGGMRLSNHRQSRRAHGADYSMALASESDSEEEWHRNDACARGRPKRPANGRKKAASRPARAEPPRRTNVCGATLMLNDRSGTDWFDRVAEDVRSTARTH